MNINSGKVICRKVTALPRPENINGNNVVTKMIITIIMLNAVIRYLNFNEYSPINNIKERTYYVNNAGLPIWHGGLNERI